MTTTDILLQKVEEKALQLMTEVNGLRKELVKLRQENITLKAEFSQYTQKLQGLVALLDTLNSEPFEKVKPEVKPIVPAFDEYELETLQGKEDYAAVF